MGHTTENKSGRKPKTISKIACRLPQELICIVVYYNAAVQYRQSLCAADQSPPLPRSYSCQYFAQGPFLSSFLFFSNPRKSFSDPKEGCSFFSEPRERSDAFKSVSLRFIHGFVKTDYRFEPTEPRLSCGGVPSLIWFVIFQNRGRPGRRGRTTALPQRSVQNLPEQLRGWSSKDATLPTKNPTGVDGLAVAAG